jgi:hypothetical protein
MLRIAGPSLSPSGRGGIALWNSLSLKGRGTRGPRSGREGEGSDRPRRHLRPRPAAAARSPARIPLRPAGASLSRAAERRGRADRQGRSRCAGRDQRGRTLDLWRHARPQRPHRTPARRGGGSGSRRPSPAARAQRGDAVRLLARSAQGRRHRRDDDAGAARRRGGDDRRARPSPPRHRRRPLPRRRPTRPASSARCSPIMAMPAAAGSSGGWPRSSPASRPSTPIATTWR